MYSLSTCWNSHRHSDGRAMLREIRGLGFEYAELSHGTRLGLLPGILEAVDAGEMKISSVHKFCPLPIGVNHSAPNLYQFTAHRARERELAERYTLKTLEFAARVKAPVVVLHAGSIEMKNYTDKLLDLVEQLIGVVFHFDAAGMQHYYRGFNPGGKFQGLERIPLRQLAFPGPMGGKLVQIRRRMIYADGERTKVVHARNLHLPCVH